mgnify:CR=1 FL=1
MKKTTAYLGGMSPTNDYRPNVKTITMPEILESYVDDAGDVQHILKNGNTLSENNFVKHWGQPKGVINMKAKDPNPDRRKIV